MIYREIPDFDLLRIADSGQCFRMNPLPGGAFSIIARGRYLEIKALGENRFQFSCTENEFGEIWADYFDLSADYSRIRDRIPSYDHFLQQAVDYGWGMRILNQDPWEMTVSFIISQRKNIPAIKTAIESLCTNFGDKRVCDGKEYFCFPSPENLIGLACSDIRCCALGYRDKYILRAAQSVKSGDIDFKLLRAMDEESAGTALKSLYGVGEKVANCILLFGLHHTNAFPEDTWINRIVDAEYSGIFPKSLYDGYLGIIQQYMFYFGRSDEYRQKAPLNSPGCSTVLIS